MVHPRNGGKLLSFPLSTTVREAAAQNWDLRILETRDNLVNALDYLRDEYNARLAGKATSADEVLARVETILRDEKVSWYTVVAKLTVHAPTPRDAKTEGSAVLSRCDSAAVKALKESTLRCITDRLSSSGRIV
jgi:hypothetical protein